MYAIALPNMKRAPLIIRGARAVQDVPPFINLCKRLVNEEKHPNQLGAHFCFSTLKIPGMEFLEVPKNTLPAPLSVLGGCAIQNVQRSTDPDTHAHHS